MKTITTIAALREELSLLRAPGKSIGFVPTMGCLHAGHLSLLRRSAEENEVSVMSLFVNPTQFDEEADLAAYPRDMEQDLCLAEEAQVDIVFAPSAEEMYKPNRSTMVLVQNLTDGLCGISRGRGHFAGVCTVVLKLLNIVQPDLVYFGQKDAQQALIVQRMVIDLDVPVRISVCPIVREEDGLAMSSRNVRIPEAQREQALALRRALICGREAIQNGEHNVLTLINLMVASVVEHPEVELDYLDIVAPETLQDVKKIDDLVLIAGAIKLGEVRLIDNLLVSPDGPWEDE